MFEKIKGWFQDRDGLVKRIKERNDSEITDGGDEESTLKPARTGLFKNREGIFSNDRVEKRRKFRLDRLGARTKLASARKWMWIALAIIAIVVGVLAVKFGVTGGLL